MIINLRVVRENLRQPMFLMRILCCLMTGLLIASSTSTHLQAQTTSNVTGVVSDPSKAAIVGATVKVESQDSGVMRSAVTNSHGVYHVEALAAGDYG